MGTEAQPAEGRKAYTITEAMQLIGRNRQAGYQLMKEKKLATFRSGRRRMVSARALQDYLDQAEASEKQAA